ANQAVDHYVVRATEGVDSNRLYAVRVQGDGGYVTGEAQSVAVGGKSDILIDVRAVDNQRIACACALDEVASVTGVPDDGIISVEVEAITALPAGNRVPARTANNHVTPASTTKRVIAFRAE